jgi:hypothetical protein
MTLIVDHPLLLFLASFLLLWLATWAGIAFRLRRSQLSEGTRSDYGVILGATLTLLGLIIGFTFSMATSRFDLRRSLEEEEANAIGTEYARLDFLPPQDSSQLKRLLRQYTDLRIESYKTPDGRELKKIDADTARVQNQLWTIVAGAAKSQPSPLSALASSGMNDVLNSQGYTQAAWRNRIPVAAWSLLFLIALLSNLLVGYGSHGKAMVLSMVLPLAVSISFFLISDIDSPRGGVIRIQPDNLYALSENLKGQ